MLNRKPLRPNNQQVTSVLGKQWAVKYPKSNETQSIVSWSTPGKGVAGESQTGGPNTKRTNIRKGPMR